MVAPVAAVVIPAHGASATIARTLEALAIEARSVALARPIVVASPVDATAEIAEAMGARVVRTPRRLNAGLARNIGRAHAGECELVLFVDADCAPQRGAICHLHEALLSHRLDAVGASVLADGRDAIAWVRHLLEFKDAEPGCEPAWPGFVPSATFLCRADAFDAVGGFPDLWPGEDLVLCSRLLRAGFRVRRVDAAVTLHRHPPGFATMLRHQYALGLSSARARRLAPMDGDFFVRHRRAVPLLLAGRSIRMVRWLVQHHPGDIVRSAGALPLYLAGLLVWCVGFARGADDGRSA